MPIKGAKRGPYQRKPAIDRFMRKVQIQDAQGCWLWQGATKQHGYGLFAPQGHIPRTVLAHRWLYQFVYGKIDASLSLCHHCDTPACVNPTHMFVGTHHDNMQDCWAKGRHAWQHSTTHPRWGTTMKNTFSGKRGFALKNPQQKNPSSKPS